MNLRDEKNISSIFAEMTRARPDLVSAELVEKGIALQEIRGTPYAAEFLKSHWISFGVALRVLSRPSQRRSPGMLLPN